MKRWFFFLVMLPFVAVACDQAPSDSLTTPEQAVESPSQVYPKPLRTIPDALLPEGPGIPLAPATSNEAWTVLADVPAVGTGVEGMSVAAVGNFIIAAAGYDNWEGDTQTTRIYDIAHDTWGFGADAPAVNSEGAGVSHDGFVYSVGGRVDHQALWRYDPLTDTWAELADLPEPKRGLGAAVVGDGIFAIGGSDGSSPCTGTESASVYRYDILTDAWAQVADLPSARSDLAAAVKGGKIYVFGGCTGLSSELTIIADVDVYDPVTDTWDTSPTDMPLARAYFYAVGLAGNTIYVGGGDGPDCLTTDGCEEVHAYNVTKDVWTTGLPDMPTGRGEVGAVSHGGRIYIVGGSLPAFGNSDDAMEAYKPIPKSKG
jgi:N-acetylneuraminic acid mutarotase